LGNSYAPSAGRTIRASLAPQITRLYLAHNGIEYELRTEGPAAGSLVLNEHGEHEVDPDGAAKIARAADQSLIVY